MAIEDHDGKLALPYSDTERQFRENFNTKVYGKKKVPQSYGMNFVQDSDGIYISRRPKEISAGRMAADARQMMKRPALKIPALKF